MKLYQSKYEYLSHARNIMFKKMDDCLKNGENDLYCAWSHHLRDTQGEWEKEYLNELAKQGPEIDPLTGKEWTEADKKIAEELKVNRTEESYAEEEAELDDPDIATEYDPPPGAVPVDQDYTSFRYGKSKDTDPMGVYDDDGEKQGRRAPIIEKPYDHDDDDANANPYGVTDEERGDEDDDDLLDDDTDGDSEGTESTEKEGGNDDSEDTNNE